MKKVNTLYRLILLVVILITINITVHSQNNILISENSELGKVLTDENGITLYYFTKDAEPNASACMGGCLNAWPVFYVESPQVGSELEIGDLGSFQRADGAMQSTYKGWPLYYFASDSNPGDVNGEGVGTVWYVAKPDYSIVLVNDLLIGLDEKTYTGEYNEGEEEIQFFVDAYGRTLYTWINDKFDTNNFTKEDFSNNAVWPIYGEDLEIPSSLDTSDFDLIDVFGQAQLTYKGWPLYYFGQDAERGETKGVSVPAPGVWPVGVKEITPAPKANNIKLSENSIYGKVLTDSDGMTLYYFTKDTEPNASACMGGCLSAWPVFYVESPQVDNGLEIGDFGSFQRADGTMQSTYKGWPLYYFASDNSPGDTNGEGVGTVWYVAKPDYSILLIDDILVGLDGVTYNSQYEEGEEEIQFFVDAYGRTLYGWINDKFNTNNFTKDDFSNDGVWPIYGPSLESVPSSLDRSLFEVINVFGRDQITYKGWPLYYFGQDTQRGETKGVSVPAPGVWPILFDEIESAPKVVSIKELATFISDVSVYPNPFITKVSIKLNTESTKVVNIHLTNSAGQRVHTLSNYRLEKGSNTLSISNLDNLHSGLYWLSIDGDREASLSLPILRN